jgi:hypothetical protein
MDDLPAPERPMSSTLRCFWRLPRSGVLMLDLVAGVCKFFEEACIIAVLMLSYLAARNLSSTGRSSAAELSLTKLALPVTTGLGAVDFSRYTSNLTPSPTSSPVSKPVAIATLSTRHVLPLRLLRQARILYLSVLDALPHATGERGMNGNSGVVSC